MRFSVLTLKVVLLSVVASVIAGFSVFSLTRIGWFVFGLPEDVTAAAYIREHYPIHFVRPEWVTGADQLDILIFWTVAEIKARVTVMLVLWILFVSFFVWQHYKRRRHHNAEVKSLILS
jgi:uncharacterized membrane protein YqjE